MPIHRRHYQQCLPALIEAAEEQLILIDLTFERANVSLPVDLARKPALIGSEGIDIAAGVDRRTAER